MWAPEMNDPLEKIVHPQLAARKQLIGIGVVERKHSNPQSVQNFVLTKEYGPSEDALQRLSQPRPNLRQVNTTQQLTKLAGFLQKHKVVAVDLEKTSGLNYTPRVSLLQISTTHHDYIVDVLALYHCIGKELKDPLERALIVAYNGANDIIDITEQFGINLNAVFDAGAYVQRAYNTPQAVGFTEGMTKILGKAYPQRHADLKKKWQKSGWQQRPLEPEQLEYARGDSMYLMQAWLTLWQMDVSIEILHNFGVEPMKQLVASSIVIRDNTKSFMDDFEASPTKANLTSDQKHKLLCLWDYRKLLAILYDRNPNVLLKFGHLVELTLNPPSTVDKLNVWIQKKVEDDEIGTLIQKRHSQTLLRVAKEGQQALMKVLATQCRRCFNFGHLENACYMKRNWSVYRRTINLLHPDHARTLAMRDKARRLKRHPEEANRRWPIKEPKKYEFPPNPMAHFGLPKTCDIARALTAGTEKKELVAEAPNNVAPKCPWTGTRPTQSIDGKIGAHVPSKKNRKSARHYNDRYHKDDDSDFEICGPDRPLTEEEIAEAMADPSWG